eukprot:10806209-Lingulodinium_polyedra.AAC.1
MQNSAKQRFVTSHFGEGARGAERLPGGGPPIGGHVNSEQRLDFWHNVELTGRGLRYLPPTA